MRKAWRIWVGIAALATGCVGTDYENDPIVGESMTVSHQTVALMPGEEVQVTAQYFDKYGIEQNVSLVWTSTEPTVASVNATGLITANANGQTIVQPSFGSFLGPQIQVTVVDDPTAVATVEITSPSGTTLTLGEKVQLTVTVKNINGEVLPGKVVEWFSENSSIVTVTPSGEIEGVAAGVAGIHAKSEGIKSNIINFTVDAMVRMGTFSAAGGYNTSGSTTLALVNDELILTLSSDFDTDFALGTYIYLANSTNGPTVRSDGFQVAQIFADGAHSFNITQLNSGIQLNDYKYVIALCYPASVTFGYAELK